LLKSTQEICPGRFAPEITAQIMDQAVKAHQALSCGGYSRSDFIVSQQGADFSRNQHLAGSDQGFALPKALKAQGIEFVDFLQGQIALATKRAHK